MNGHYSDWGEVGEWGTFDDKSVIRFKRDKKCLWNILTKSKKRVIPIF